MSKRTLAVACLVVFFIASMTSARAAEPGKTGPHKENLPNLMKLKAAAYAIPTASRSSAPAESRIPLGAQVFTTGSYSPGVAMGISYLDQQHIGAVGRMIETGPHSGETGDAIVHFGWMYLADDNPTANLSYAYAAYRSENYSLVGPIILTTAPAQGGYVNVDVTPDNRALVGGHLDEGDGFQPHIFFDGGPAYATFLDYTRVPDSTAAYGQDYAFEAMWPKFFFQFGTDTVLHVLAKTGGAIMYFRKVGFESSPASNWDYPPYVVDTVAGFGHDIIGQRNGDRVCMVWPAGLPYQETLCDTCSGISVYDGFLIGQMDNDIYYQESYDQGATFEPRVNVTQVPIGEAAWKAYTDISVLYDSDDNLHIVWPACPWAADLCVEEGGWCFAEDWHIKNARLMHWSENVPYIRPIADQVYDVNDPVFDSCYSGAWNLLISKPSLAECDGNLYAIWAQFNDGKQGVVDDCAEWAWKKDDPFGSANADLWVSVSENGGMTWDYPRNLTNTYTPHCDPKFGTDCASENWASMSRSGRQNQPGEDWNGSIVIDPAGTYTGDYYLDIQYVADRDAGAVVQDEGSWTNNLLNWFRMACFDPIPQPIFNAEWTQYGDPNYCKPGESFDTMLMIENIGNAGLSYIYTVIEDNGTPGWLNVSGYSGYLPSGLAGSEYGDITVNANLMTAYGNYYGRIHFEGNDPVNLPADIEIELIIADTIVTPTWDIGNTNCLSLVVSSHGNAGKNGSGTNNMDYYDAGDCDTTAKVYLYDGSPLIGRIIGDDTVFNWALSTSIYFDQYSFRPQGGELPAKVCAGDAMVFHSGTFTTQDSAIGMEKIWVWPQNDCEFIIEYMRIVSHDGATHSEIMIGEVVDWNIPTDYPIDDVNLARDHANIGGIDGPRSLVYCQGYEAYGLGSDTLYPYNCQYNDNRFGGQAFVESYLNDAPRTTAAYSGFVGENDSLMGSDGFFHGKLYYEMAQSGLRNTDSVEDLHTVLTFEPALDFGASDVYEVVTVLATVENGTLGAFQAAIDAGKAWYYANGGMNLFDKEGISISLCNNHCVYMGKFYDDVQPFSILDIDNWINWMFRDPSADPPDRPDQLDIVGGEICFWAGNVCVYPDNQLDILDLEAWVECLFITGNCPEQCPEPVYGCCVKTGDFDHDGDIDETDAALFAQWIASSGWPTCEDPPCCDELDVNGDGDITILDVDYLVAYVYSSGPAPAPCGTYSGSNDYCWKCQPVE